MFGELIQSVHQLMAENDWELSRCNDPYRLAHIICQFKLRLSLLEGEAREMVRELEDRDNGQPL